MITSIAANPVWSGVRLSARLRPIIALPTFTQQYVLRLAVGPLFTPVRYTPSTRDSSR